MSCNKEFMLSRGKLRFQVCFAAYLIEKIYLLKLRIIKTT